MIKLGTPELGQKIVVALPGELLRAEIVDIKSDDEIVAALTIQPPMVKSGHFWHFGDRVPCRRVEDGPWGQKWQSIGHGPNAEQAG